MAKPDNLRLDDQLCFALYAATNQIVRAYRPLLRGIGLTYPQYLAMLVLWEHGTQTVTEIADRLALPGHAVTPLLQRLEAAGHVARIRDAADRRVTRVTLTAQGRGLEARAAEIQHTVAGHTRLCPDDLAGLRGHLHSLTEALGETTDGPDPRPAANPRQETA